MTHTPQKMRHQVARSLIDAGCVTVRSDEPFRLPSGWASPVHMDCRRLLSFVPLRRELVRLGTALLAQRNCLDGVSSIVGAESSGIALAAWMCEALDMPMQYVRKKTKGYSDIEGVLAANSQVILVDDLMATGHSKLSFVRTLTAAGVSVKDVFVIFDYGVFPGHEILAPLGIEVHSLANWHDIADVAIEHSLFDAKSTLEIEQFLQAPRAWSQAHGGIFSYV